jgi:hypothetical protein
MGDHIIYDFGMGLASLDGHRRIKQQRVMGLGNVPWSVIVSRRLVGLTVAMLAALGIPAVSVAGEAPIRIGAPLPLTGGAVAGRGEASTGL